jgi:hypothetical protein
LKSIPDCAKEQRNGCEPLLPVDHPKRIFVLVNHKISDEVLGVVLLDCVIPKVFNVRAVPRVGALESWDTVEGLFEKLGNLLIDARNLHGFELPLWKFRWSMIETTTLNQG